MSTRQNRRGTLGKVTGVLVLGVLVAAGCGNNAEKHQTTLDPQGKVASEDFHIFNAFFIVAAIIGIGVILATIFVALRFRERAGNENPVQVHGNTVLEISWTIAPALILMVMAVFTVKLIWSQAEKPKDAIEITVTGKQWWWEFKYTNVDPQNRVVTANELHIPQGRPVYLTLRSDNVIHSFWIPGLAGKRDVVPGHFNHISLIADDDIATEGKPALFYGQCAEYCGLSHADMRNTTYVETESDFQKWYQNQLKPWTSQQVATFKDFDKTYRCSACHYVQGLDPETDAKVLTGESQPINVGPNLTHLAERKTFGGAIFDLNFDNLWQWVYDAPRHSTSDFGKYNQCPNRSPGGKTGPGTDCKVGMPSMKNDPDTPMSEATAKRIAEFLLSTKNSASQ